MTVEGRREKQKKQRKDEEGDKGKGGKGKEGEGSRFISAVATPLSLAKKSQPTTLPLPNPERPCKGME